MEESKKYADIIHMPHPVSSRHAGMTNSDRAAQFAPFAALTGYEEEIAETARLTTPRIELTESQQQVLDRKYQYLRSHIREQPTVTVTYFQPDLLKEGGGFLTVTGQVKKIDEYQKILQFTNGEKIQLEEIICLVFSAFDKNCID